MSGPENTMQRWKLSMNSGAVETKPNGQFDTRSYHTRMNTGDRPMCKPICQPKGLYRC